MHSDDPKITLAVDTSGKAGSVAVGQGSDLWMAESFSGALRHNAELFTTIQGLLNKFNQNPSAISHIGITQGPGSFTGIRIAVAMAKMISLANNADIACVRSSDALVENVGLDSEWRFAGTVIDAKRGQFFTAIFEKTDAGWRKIVDDCLVRPAEFMEKAGELGGSICLLGEGLHYYKDRFAGENTVVLPEETWSVRAENVYRLAAGLIEAGELTSARDLEPFYLRKSDAEEQKHGQA